MQNEEQSDILSATANSVAEGELVYEGMAKAIRRMRARFSESAIEWVLGIGLIASFAAWTAPALRTVRTTVAPTAAAVEWMRAHERAPGTTLYVGRTMTKFVEYSLPGVPFVVVANEHALPLRDTPGVLLAEWLSGDQRELGFRRDRGYLWNVARRCFFDVSMSPLRPAPVFLDGWSPVDVDPRGEFRRMGERSVMLLPSVQAPSWLTLEVETPSSSSAVEVRLDGDMIGRAVSAGSHLEVEYKVRPSAAASHRLEITAPGGGLVLRRISWGHRVRK